MNKLLFFLKRPKVVVVTGEEKDCAREALFEVLKPHFKIGKDVLLLKENGRFFLKRSKLPILIITSGKTDLVSVLPDRGFLVLNSDDQSAREIKNKSSRLTFGFSAKADIRATDDALTHFPGMGTNFKINHQGNTVPVWLEETFGKEQIYSALAAVAAGKLLGLNLVEISESLKNYRSLPGKMRLIPGIKNCWILDDAARASLSSMKEALDILAKIPIEQGRKIAVLGDVLGTDKYAPEFHEAIGEKAAKTVNLLFTIGNKARFFAEGAFKKGMPKEKVFSFSTIKEAGLVLQKEIKENDLILVDGSKEMSMMDLVEEIKAGPIV